MNKISEEQLLDFQDRINILGEILYPNGGMKSHAIFDNDGITMINIYDEEYDTFISLDDFFINKKLLVRYAKNITERNNSMDEFINWISILKFSLIENKVPTILKSKKIKTLNLEKLLELYKDQFNNNSSYYSDLRHILSYDNMDIITEIEIEIDEINDRLKLICMM